MAIPEGYEKLAVVGIAWKGDYVTGTAYQVMNAVYYRGSTYVALRDNPTGPPTADNTNWQYLAKGFVAALLSMVTATDTSGLIGTAGAEVGAQALMDVLARKVATELVSDTALTERLGGYLLKSQIVNNLLATEPGNVLDAMQGKALGDAVAKVNSDLGDKTLPQNTSDDVRIVTPANAAGVSATFYLSKTGGISSQTRKNGIEQTWCDFVSSTDLIISISKTANFDTYTKTGSGWLNGFGGGNIGNNNPAAIHEGEGIFEVLAPTANIVLQRWTINGLGIMCRQKTGAGWDTWKFTPWA